MVTGLVLPASAIVILAGQKESLSICRFEWTLEALCFLVTVLTFAIIAIENYARLILPPERFVYLILLLHNKCINYNEKCSVILPNARVNSEH